MGKGCERVTYGRETGAAKASAEGCKVVVREREVRVPRGQLCVLTGRNGGWGGGGGAAAGAKGTEAGA